MTCWSCWWSESGGHPSRQLHLTNTNVETQMCKIWYFACWWSSREGHEVTKVARFPPLGNMNERMSPKFMATHQIDLEISPSGPHCWMTDKMTYRPQLLLSGRKQKQGCTWTHLVIVSSVTKHGWLLQLGEPDEWRDWVEKKRSRRVWLGEWDNNLHG